MGWRRSDVLGCRLEDFTPSAERPLSVTMHGKGEKFHEITLELHPKIREVLPRYLEWRTARLAGASALFNFPPREPGTLMVAISKRDGIGPMRHSTFDNRVNGIYERSGVDAGGWPSHNLRRTWAENRLQAAMAEFAETANPVEAL